MKPIISVNAVSKQYRIGVRDPYGSLRESLMNAARAPLRRLAGNGRKPKETIWALRDVSFNVAPGEALGIIGHNGAGKSTLLKVLSRITEPTAGRIELFGRVGSLLEVGTGFHPELTGRENIFLNGAILGMRREEIEKKFDEIVSFAEIEKFLETPVKRYSSGMYMRLAFAVAAHLEPEILVVDEVLAVGDAQFQKKCLSKMGDVTREGRTVLFVSHNMMAIQNLCRRAIWLEAGRVLEDNESGRVVASYLQHSFSSRAQQIWDDPSTAPGNDKVRLRSAQVRPAGGSPSEPISIRTPFLIEFEYWNLQAGARLDISLHIYNEQGILAFNPGTLHEPAWHGRDFPVGLFRTTCRIPGDLLNDGLYRVQLLIVRDEGIIVHSEDEALVFEVRDDAEMRGAWLGKWPGVIRPNLEWKTELQQSDVAPEVSN